MNMSSKVGEGRFGIPENDYYMDAYLDDAYKADLQFESCGGPPRDKYEYFMGRGLCNVFKTHQNQKLRYNPEDPIPFPSHEHIDDRMWHNSLFVRKVFVCNKKKANDTYLDKNRIWKLDERTLDEVRFAILDNLKQDIQGFIEELAEAVDNINKGIDKKKYHEPFEIMGILYGIYIYRSIMNEIDGAVVYMETPQPFYYFYHNALNELLDNRIEFNDWFFNAVGPEESDIWELALDEAWQYNARKKRGY